MALTPTVAQTQVFTGNLQFAAQAGGVINLPCLPGVRLSWPKNYSIPPILGNYWQFNYTEGVRLPTLEVDLVPRDKTLEALSGATGGPIPVALARSGGPAANDIAIIDTVAGILNTYQGVTFTGAVTFSNGRKALTMVGAKVDGFVISVGSKGDDLRIKLRIVGCACFATYGIGTAAPAGIGIPPWDNATPLRFQSSNFYQSAACTTIHTTLGNAVTSWSLSYNNNCTPDPSLNGTTAPAAINAGLPTCSLSLSVQAATIVDQNLDGQSVTIGIKSPPTGTGSSAGLGLLAAFTLNNVLNATPDELNQTAPRVLTPHQFICRGSDSATNGPIAFTSTF